jgi:hypothetical protein
MIDTPVWITSLLQVVAQASSALLTPIIAVIATYIAWQQWKTNKQKYAFDLYERRLRVYEEVRKILSLIGRDAKVDPSQLLEFRTSVMEADFLFGREIPEYIDDVYRHGVELWRWTTEHRDYTQSRADPPTGYNHEQVVKGMAEELQWLMAQHEVARQKFGRYLSVSR